MERAAAPIALLALAVLVLHARTQAPSKTERANFLLIEHVGSLTIYNQYQQRLSAAEYAPIPFLPMRIVAGSGFLGDGYTPVMKVETEGRIFYVLLDGKRRAVRNGPSGFFRIYRKVTPLDDSVLVRKGGALTLTTALGNRSLLEKSTVLRRYFAEGALTYVGRGAGSDQSFGWVRLDPARNPSVWSHPEAEKMSGIPPTLIEKVRTRLAGVNRTLRVLFDLLGRETAKTLSVPEWQAIQDGETIVCTLSGDSSLHVFSESTRTLSNDFEGYTIGTDFSVTTKPRRIEIRRR